MSRTMSSVKNIKYSITGQILGLLVNFITRMVFVRSLSVEYLGINGLFTNILSILSFAELGIGTAIVYSMYKPLAERNIDLLKGLMKLYKQAYLIIGSLILILGFMLTPFLYFFIREVPEIDNLKLIYLLFVFNTASTYFFSYKRSFLIADQKKYIDALYHYAFHIIKGLLQIIILIMTKNFILYLSIQIIVTFIENYSISLKVDRMYPFINDTKDASINKDVRFEIVKNVKAMLFHKMGSVVVMGTDNLLISKFVGLIEVGLYSNYLLIITAINQIFVIVFQSMIASIGNLGATETPKKNEFIFRCIDFIGFWIYGFASIALFTLFNPFIGFWLGERFLFPTTIVMLIVISFYLTGRRKSVLTFRDALGLFWYDRHKPIFESIINLTVSIYLVTQIGLEGILLGTIISTITTSLWIEPYVLYKHGFKTSMGEYFARYAKFTVIILTIGILNVWITGFLGSTLFAFFGKAIITLILPNILITALFWNTKEFQYLMGVIAPVVIKRMKK